VTNASQPDDTLPARQILITFVQTNLVPLLGAIRLYVYRSGLAQGIAVPATAADVLQDVVVEALSHADRFDPERQPLAWLLGIAVNIVRRRKAQRASLHRRELPITVYVDDCNPEIDVGESDIFERLGAHVLEGPETLVEANEQAETLLSMVSPDDQRVLRLAVLGGVSGESLAHALGTTPGTARIRLHRALQRLRSALAQRTDQDEVDSTTATLERRVGRE
jgi:RNA polymerase sigma factor (sigma-70 family)